VSADQAITIELPPALGNARHQAAHRAFFLWVKPRLTQQVATLAGDIAATLGTRPRAIRVKAMRSRWGSCGPANDININWLLALVPQEVLRYVVIHELCHIRQRNHSAAFWALVSQSCPDYRSHRHWLRIHGHSLIQRFAPAS
jgi:predicted metal-dependent hydrolase